MNEEENKSLETTVEDNTGAPEGVKPEMNPNTPLAPETPQMGDYAELLAMFKQMQADINALKNVGAPIVGDNTTPQPTLPDVTPINDTAEQTHEPDAEVPETETQEEEETEEEDKENIEEADDQSELEKAEDKALDDLFTY